MIGVLSRWQVVVSGVEPRLVTHASLHTVCSGWLDTDGGVGDHHADTKQHAVGVLRRRGDGLAALEVSFLDTATRQRMRERVTAGAQVRFGSQRAVVVEVGETQVGQWDQVLAPGPPSECRWRVTFLSPTTFHHRHRHSPWPDPRSVVLGLHRRMGRVLGSRCPPLPRLRSDSVLVTRVQGATRSAQLGRKYGQVPGFVGTIDYAMDPAEDGFAVVQAAFRLAPWSGIGAHTAFGLGAVSVAISGPGRGALST